MSILQVVGAIANFLTLIALARLLSPKDFGIAAVASLVTGFIGTFGDFGLGPAVIQRTTEVEKALYTANTLRLAIATIMFSISAASASFAASLFSAPEAVGPIVATSALFLLNGAMFVPQTRLSKEMRFGVVLKAALASTLVSAVVSVALAYSGFGYWTIVIASLVAAAANVGALWILAPWRIAIEYDRRIARELVAYGKHLFLTTIFVFLILNVDDAGVAYFLGPVYLGFYALAFKWANVPVNFLSRVTAQVMTPAYVILRDAPDRLRRGYLETVQLVLLASLPVYLGLLFFADEFVAYLLGPVWSPIVMPMRVLCGMGIFRGLAEPGGYLFMATGDSRLVSRSTAIHLVFLSALVLPGLLLWGLTGVALAVTVAYIGNLIVVQRYVRRVLGVTWGDVAERVRSLGLAGLAMIGTLIALKLAFVTSLWLFIAGVGTGLAVFLVVIYVQDGEMILRYFRQIRDMRRGA